MDRVEPPPLDADAVEHLWQILHRVQQFPGPWAVAPEPVTRPDGRQVWPMYVNTAEEALEPMRFLYDHGLIIPFDWASWDEGRRLIGDPEDNGFASLDRLTVLKLLTAVARNDRFNAGAWASLFKDGRGQKLLARLYDLERA
jgi:hypothetical protein